MSYTIETDGITATGETEKAAKRQLAKLRREAREKESRDHESRKTARLRACERGLRVLSHCCNSTAPDSWELLKPNGQSCAISYVRASGMTIDITVMDCDSNEYRSLAESIIGQGIDYVLESGNGSPLLVWIRGDNGESIPCAVGCWNGIVALESLPAGIVTIERFQKNAE